MIGPVLNANLLLSILYSSYAQKVRLALREKDLPFERHTPQGFGSGKPDPNLLAANPRMEVPALLDRGNGGVTIFDSTIILEYLEEQFPDAKPMLPKGAVARAKARMIEDVCDTVYEALNWGYGEVEWGGRATGDLAKQLKEQVQVQTVKLQSWLSDQLGSQPYFNGDDFGWADISVAPLLNRSVFYGYGPAKGSNLDQWYQKIVTRPHVKTTFAEMEQGAAVAAKMFKKIFAEGTGNRREYRDHRLEFLIKSGGIDIVLQGIKEKTIRFSWPEADFGQARG